VSLSLAASTPVVRCRMFVVTLRSVCPVFSSVFHSLVCLPRVSCLPLWWNNFSILHFPVLHCQSFRRTLRNAAAKRRKCCHGRGGLPTPWENARIIPPPDRTAPPLLFASPNFNHPQTREISEEWHYGGARNGVIIQCWTTARPSDRPTHLQH